MKIQFIKPEGIQLPDKKRVPFKRTKPPSGDIYKDVWYGIIEPILRKDPNYLQIMKDLEEKWNGRNNKQT